MTYMIKTRRPYQQDSKIHRMYSVMRYMVKDPDPSSVNMRPRNIHQSYALQNRRQRTQSLSGYPDRVCLFNLASDSILHLNILLLVIITLACIHGSFVPITCAFHTCRLFK